MSKIYIGIDNGVTGTIGIVGDDIDPQLFKTPIKVEQNYTKAKDNIKRLDVSDFFAIFDGLNKNDIVAVMERPLINPTRFKSTVSALRCFEAELITLEMLGIKRMYVDSKAWQRKLLPSGVTGPDLKKASLDIGNRLFPMFEDFKHPDRDGILIAEYARRENL